MPRWVTIPLQLIHNSWNFRQNNLNIWDGVSTELVLNLGQIITMFVLLIVSARVSIWFMFGLQGRTFIIKLDCSTFDTISIFLKYIIVQDPWLILLPTIEPCFNCFGICSFDAKEIIKRRPNRPGNSKVTQPLSTPPPLLAEKRDSPRWRQCLKEKFLANNSKAKNVKVFGFARNILWTKRPSSLGKTSHTDKMFFTETFTPEKREETFPIKRRNVF